MTDHKRTSKRLAQELYDHRNDDGEWDDEPVNLVYRPSQTTVVSLRLPREEYRDLKRAAVQAGESVSDYVRTAVRQ